MNKLLITFLFAAFFFSCNSTVREDNRADENNIEQDSTIDMITVQCFPSFIGSSIFILDLSDKKLIIKLLWSHTRTRFVPPPGKNNTIYAPKSMYVALDDETISYFQDSIKYESKDFLDGEILGNDGKANSLVFYLRNKETIDVDLNNYTTDNQLKLILKLIDICISQSSNPKVTSYLKDLKDYY